MDNEMIEQVATAITKRRTGRNYSSIELAIAAIKAMREPTEKMLAAADGPWCDDDRPELKREYQAMLDAIIGDV